jgi:drug/metabolite transporter (DMT)-like permease
MSKQLRGFIFLIITIILFSTFEVVCKLIGTRLHPLQITLFRFLIGGLVLLPFALFRIKKQELSISKHFWFDMFLLGFVNIVVSMGLIQFGLLYTNASTSAVIFSSNPIFVAVFAAILLKESISKVKLIGMVIGIIGVFILFFDKISLSSTSVTGPILVLMSAIVFALYTVLGKKLTLQGTDSLVMTAFSFITGSILLLPIMLVLKIPLLAMDLNILPHVLYLGILVSGIAYMCYFYGLANVNTSTGALVFFVKPALAALFSVLVLHETLKTNFYIGTVIILAALTIVNLKQLFRVTRRL